MNLFGSQTTVTEIRIHGYEYDSNINALSCMVAFDVVYLQSVPPTRSNCRAWPSLSGLLANCSGSFRRRARRLAIGTVLSQIADCEVPPGRAPRPEIWTCGSIYLFA